eukprot:TRINITY_DN16763_c0_g1_i1.p2 TRINITY_DN16763_c0_g1~~TRINITY_DN16763_c0_g1_i1.p2  ORF type:complete len:100 (+),score=8.90 TRINITY_DN16763_c0_g1_i1:121-420(+)
MARPAQPKSVQPSVLVVSAPIRASPVHAKVARLPARAVMTQNARLASVVAKAEFARSRSHACSKTTVHQANIARPMMDTATSMEPVAMLLTVSTQTTAT